MTQFQQQINLLTQKMLNLEKLWELARFKPNDTQILAAVKRQLWLTAPFSAERTDGAAGSALSIASSLL